MPDPGRQGESARSALPPQVTTPLLTLITQQSLDEDYRHAAERRARAGTAAAPDTSEGPEGSDESEGSAVGPPSGRRRQALVAGAAVAVFGVLVSVAFVQNARQEDVDTASRTTLLERIDSQRGRVAGLQDELAGLREQNARLQEAQTGVGEAVQEAETRLRRLRARTGFAAAQGEGVRVVVEDAPDAEPLELVSDLDLTLLVNALWSAGAEGVALNGQRVTALTAIRVSGRAIEVNGVGVASPYTVLALGDSADLQADFFDTASGLAFDAVARTQGYDYELSGEEQVTLPAGPERFERLRFARAEGRSTSPRERVEGEGQQ